MATFFRALVLLTGLMLLLAVPLFLVTRRTGRRATARRFLIAAVILGVFCAGLSASSERLVNQCRAAGNPTCLDFGASGLQTLLIAGYAIMSWIMTVVVYRE